MPFFAWIHYMDLHWPYHLEEALTHPRDITQAWQDHAIIYGRSYLNDNEPITAAQRKHFIGLYGQSLQYLDAQIGRLLDQLENSDYASNTIIILCECPVPDDIMSTSLVPLWTQREAEYDVEVAGRDAARSVASHCCTN